MKKVIVVTTDPWLDSLHGASVLEIFKELSKLKYSVKILLPSVSNRFISSKHLIIRSFRVKWMPFFTLMRLQYVFLKEVLLWKPNIIIFDPPLLFVALIAKIF